MKTFLKTILSACALLVLNAVPCLAAQPVEKGSILPGGVVVRPVPDHSMLVNPGKGFVQYWEPDTKIFYKYREPDDKYVNDYISVGYTRFNWSTLEPKEGEYDWSLFDRFIAEYGKYGKKVGFGVMSVTTGQREQYVTPKWVFDAGAVPLAIPDGSTPTGNQIIPMSWDDPVFLEKMKAFIAAFGAHYNGNPNIAFMDIRNYGNWGEGHIGGLGNDPHIRLASPESLQNNYLLPYIKAFPNTQLIAVWGHPDYSMVYDWAVTQGVGIRRDGILSKWTKNGSECLFAYGREPAIYEYCEDYEHTKKSGYWSTDSLWKSVLAGKPTYLHWDRNLFEENKEFCLKLGNKIGYHFVLEEASFPAIIKLNVPFQLVTRWLNDGVSRLYGPCYVAVALLDSKNQVVQQQWLPGSEPQKWEPDQIKTETMEVKFSPVPVGSYKFAIGLFLDKKDSNPSYKLGIQGRTTNGWYILHEKVELTLGSF